MTSTAQPSVLYVELTGPLRRAAGTDRLEIAADGVTNLAQLLIHIRQILPQTQPFLPLQPNDAGQSHTLPPGLLVARGNEILPPEPTFPLTPGDQLTLMPMISGG